MYLAFVLNFPTKRDDPIEPMDCELRKEVKACTWLLFLTFPKRDDHRARTRAKKRSKSVYLAFVLNFPTKRDDFAGFAERE